MQTRPPSILILNRTFPPYFGATGRMACDLALHLRKQGHQVTIVTTAPQAKTDTAKNLTVIRVEGDKKSNSGFQYYRILKRMARAAKKLPNHDIVISMTDPPLLAHYGHKIAQKMRAKHIHWAQDIYPELFPVLGKRLSKFTYGYIEGKMHNAMKCANAIVTIGKCMAKSLTYKSIPRRTMHVIENWPERELMVDTNTMPSTLFKDDGQKFRVLYSGTIGLAHDFDAVIKAAIFCQKHHPEIEFVFVGKGSGLPALAQAKAKNGLDNVRFLPPQPPKAVKAMMQAGDVHLITMQSGAAGLLVPSKFYSSSIIGRPVLFVGPEHCDLHEKITATKCGSSVRNNDAKGLVQAILSYRNDGNKWNTDCATITTITENAPTQNLKQWDDLIASLT
jgi:colanic acid biosynthesis glycosyl transferase WcaI